GVGPGMLRSGPPPRPIRQPPLWPVTVDLLDALQVVAFTLDADLSPGLDPGWFVNGALDIVCEGLSVSAWRGRAGWTALLAVPLLPLWVAFSAADIGRFPGSGTEDVVLTEPGAATEIEHGYGDLRVRVEPEAVPAGSTVELVTAATAGTTIIEVPDSATVVVRADIGLGELRVQADDWWTVNEALVIDRVREITYGPVRNECHPSTMSPTEMYARYGWVWQELGLTVSVDDLADPAFQIPASVAERITAVGLPEPVWADTGARWQTGADELGRPCDPDAPAALDRGTVEIDATMGLGTVSVERFDPSGADLEFMDVTRPQLVPGGPDGEVLIEEWPGD
ncbi:MAG: hypothetical protein ACK5PP_07805, partial [Acidimicrobiales bacterium]